MTNFLALFIAPLNIDSNCDDVLLADFKAKVEGRQLPQRIVHTVISGPISIRKALGRTRRVVSWYALFRNYREIPADVDTMLEAGDVLLTCAVL
jgi:hypothetical protein